MHVTIPRRLIGSERRSTMGEQMNADSESETGVFHRNIFEEPGEGPTTELVSIVADLKGVGENDLQPLYSWADHLIEDLYTSPPPAEAQGVVEFSYEGYRITLYQDGQVVLMERGNAE